MAGEPTVLGRVILVIIYVQADESGKDRRLEKPAVPWCGGVAHASFLGVHRTDDRRQPCHRPGQHVGCLLRLADTFVVCFLLYGTLSRMRHAAAGRCPKCMGKGRRSNGRGDGYDRTLPLPEGVPFFPPKSYSISHACNGSGRLYWEEEVRAQFERQKAEYGEWQAKKERGELPPQARSEYLGDNGGDPIFAGEAGRPLPAAPLLRRMLSRDQGQGLARGRSGTGPGLCAQVAVLRCYKALAP